MQLVLDKNNKRWVIVNHKTTTAFSTITPTGDYTTPATISSGNANVFQNRLNDKTNEVEFRGSVLYSGGGGAPGITIYTLPVGQRPTNIKVITVPIVGSNNTATVYVYPSGEVRCQPGGGGETISLDSVRFSLD